MKQRLVGAAVLIALGVIFLPMLVQGPAPDSGVSDVPLTVPPAPATPAMREIPLGVPEPVIGGATGMPTPVPTPMTGDVGAVPFEAVAAGDWAVSFGSYAGAADADKVIAALAKADLPAYRESVTGGNGTQVQRVRIGPFADRAVAEAARLRSGEVRGDVGAQVIALDAGAPPPAPAAAEPSKPVAAAPKPEPIKPQPAKPEPPKPVVAAPQPEAPKPEPPKPVAAKPEAPKPVAAAPKPVAAAPKPEPTRPVTAAPKPAAPAAKPAANVGFAVQVGALSSPADATALRDKLRAAGFNAFTQTAKTEKGTLTQVRVGPVADRAQADALKAQISAKAGVSGFVRPHP